MIPELPRGPVWRRRLAERRRRLRRPPLRVEGRLTRMVGLTLEAVGCQAAVGARCLVLGPGLGAAAGPRVEAEVVGFAGERTYLMPTGRVQGILPGARVVPTGRLTEARVGPELLGRILDGAGQPLDGRGPVRASRRLPLAGRPINPLERQPIRQPLDVGVRAINGLLTVGRGQRLGLFAGSGVGKSVLLGMLTRYTEADVIVVGLIGERGREVKEFIDRILGPQSMARAVVVATPADSPPLMRLHGAMLATAVAEGFRDQGLEVLLLMDSLTRFAQAQREIGLAVGEPPTTKGYPPSVFAQLPALVERAGNGERGGGSITALYTVLVEGDDQQDPVADAARAVLDGHIVLSRRLSERGHYPAIDVEASVSRLMGDIVDPEHQAAARRFRELLAIYRQNEDLITVGAYQKGSDPRVDEALERLPRMEAYLRQDRQEAVDLATSVAELRALFADPAPAGREAA